MTDFSRTLFYQNNDGYQVGPISRDRKYIGVSKPRTTNDADVYLVDRATNAAKNLTAHTGNVNNAPVDFSPDASKLLFVSDSGREFSALFSYDVATGAKALVHQEPWDVQNADYSKKGRYLVVSVNEDGRLAARILDVATMRPVSMGAMPQGVVQQVRISPNDSAFAFYNTDGSTPLELHVAAIGAAPKRLTNSLNPDIRRADLVVPKVVRFKSYDGVEVPGLLYKPHQASAAAKAPAVVFVHGGPGGQSTVGYSPLVQALVNHGYVVYAINNRGSSGYGKTFYAMDDRRHGEADLGDVVESKRMLVATGYVDADKIGIVGGSYGGYMVLAAVTLQPDAFKVGVDLFGISNWVRTLNNIPPWWGSFREALFAEMGDPKIDSARLYRISPFFNASKIKAPLMVLQGANDPRVLKVESDEIVAAAKKNGVPVEYVVFPDEGHGFVKKDNEIRGYTALIAFLDQYLKGSKKVAAK
jgi:dipeptidyl aminopeptidase/acylaminoacyl peptidase